MDPAEFLDLISHKLKYLDARARVLAIENLDPLKAVETTSWQDQMSNLGSILGLEGHALAKETDVLIFCLKHQTTAQVLSKIAQLVNLAGWQTCRSVVQQKVFVLDDAVFTNSDPLHQLEILAEIVYPKFFAFGHEGNAWLKLSV